MTERIVRFDLDQAEPGIYTFGSSSGTVYILDHDPARGTRLMRATSPDSHSTGWWDNAWVPLLSAESAGGDGVVVVGSRARWLTDPGGPRRPNAHSWLSRDITSIERWDQADLDAFLAERAEEKRARLDDVLDKELRRWTSVLDRLAREDAPSTPNVEIVERLRGQDRSRGPSQQDILDARDDERQRGSDTPPD